MPRSCWACRSPGGSEPGLADPGLFALSSDWLLRLRHNPFYPNLEKRAIEWALAHQRPHTVDELNTTLESIP